LAWEHLEHYPVHDRQLLPTRLGNALRALETYGHDTYKLDSQQFWFELVGTADSAVRQEQDEMRAQVDLFVAAIAAFSLLSVGSVAVVFVVADKVPPAALAVGSALLVPIAYLGALRNMKDWRNSIRAMINLGRFRLADGVGVVVPWRLDDEQQMWAALSGVIHGREPTARPWLDVFRRGTPYRVEGGELYYSEADIPSLPEPGGLTDEQAGSADSKV
jgi:hypothetical protein